MTDFSYIDGPAVRLAVGAEPLLAKLSGEQQELLVTLVDKLAEGQSQMNLTAIKDPIAMVRYHLADSVALADAVRESGGEVPKRAADVGTGGGFPLLPMAVLWPETDWAGIESVGKKAAFVERTARALGLDHVRVLAERAEDVGRGEERESYDLITSRAVGAVSALLEVEVPLLAEGGRLYMFKTEAAMGEWRACEEFLEHLGGKVIGEYRYALEGDVQQRVIFIAEKVQPTPREFPRLAGVPFKKPMVKAPEQHPR